MHLYLGKVTKIVHPKRSSALTLRIIKRLRLISITQQLSSPMISSKDNKFYLIINWYLTHFKLSSSRVQFILRL